MTNEMNTETTEPGKKTVAETRDLLLKMNEKYKSYRSIAEKMAQHQHELELSDPETQDAYEHYMEEYPARNATVQSRTIINYNPATKIATFKVTSGEEVKDLHVGDELDGRF